MTSRFEARVFDGPGLWQRNTVRLALRDEDRNAYLMSDGTWQSFGDGAALPDGLGVEVPRASIEAIAVAIQEFQGHASHADTEARVLREWLAVERSRVDAALRTGSQEPA